MKLADVRAKSQELNEKLAAFFEADGTGTITELAERFEAPRLAVQYQLSKLSTTHGIRVVGRKEVWGVGGRKPDAHVYGREGSLKEGSPRSGSTIERALAARTDLELAWGQRS